MSYKHGLMAFSLLFSTFAFGMQQPAKYRNPRLAQAIESGNVTLVKKFLDSGADPNLEINDQKLTLLRLALNKNQSKVADLLRQRGARLSEEGKYAHPAFARAIMTGQLGLMDKFFQNYPIDANKALTAEGHTPLHLAVREEQHPVVDKLILHGVSVDKADAQGRTPLYFAVIASNLPLVQKLLNAGADPNVQVAGQPIWQYANTANIQSMLIGSGKLRGTRPAPQSTMTAPQSQQPKQTDEDKPEEQEQSEDVEEQA